MDPGEFESQQREEMLRSMVEQVVRDSIKISDQELWDTYSLDKEKVKLTYLAFDPKRYEGQIQPIEKQLRDYFQKNAESFKTPEKRKVLYALFAAQDYQENVQILTGDIEDYYESHIDQYSHPEEVNLRQILIKVAPHEDKGGFEEKRKKIEGILERIKKGEDFAQLANTFSEDRTAKDGGNLGYVKKSELVPEIEHAVADLKPGEVSGIVSSPYGFHILKMEGYRSAKADPLEEVKASIEGQLKQEKARVLARRKAEEYLWSVKDQKGAGMVPGEGRGQPPVRETGYLARGESIPGIGKEEAFTQAAFSLQSGELSDVIKGNKAFYIIKVLDRKDPSVPPYEDVVDSVKKRFIGEESKVQVRKKAEEALEQLREGKDPVEVAKEIGIQSSDTEWFNRVGSYIPKLGASQELKESAFSLTEKDPFPKNPVEIDGKFYVVKLKDRSLPSKDEFASQIGSLRREQEEKKQQEAYRAWLAELRTGVDIRISNAEL
jgi:peptidyl-prolyl cis-trans isomerase D